jgi:hypothetical protein
VRIADHDASVDPALGLLECHADTMTRTQLEAALDIAEALASTSQPRAHISRSGDKRVALCGRTISHPDDEIPDDVPRCPSCRVIADHLTPN